MKASGKWEKVNPKDAKIIALATKVRQLKELKSKKGNQLDLRHVTKKRLSIVINGETL